MKSSGGVVETIPFKTSTTKRNQTNGFWGGDSSNGGLSEPDS